MDVRKLRPGGAEGRRFAPGKPGLPTRVYRNFIFDPRRNFVFAYVPKVACTNWKAVMRYLAGFENYLDPRMAHDRAVNGLTYLDFAEDGNEILSDPAVRVYTCLRDPYTRILSAYLDKVDRRLSKLNEPADPPAVSATDSPAAPVDHFMKVTRDVDDFRKEKLDPAAYPVVSFEVFMLWLSESNSRFRSDEHWQTQSVLLRWPDVSFDDIARFETLASDSARLLGKMGCDIDFPTQSAVRFPATDASSRRENYFTPLARRLAAEIYREDFENFGYAI